ncbi:MAG: amidohydrolase family protein, partial [Hoeflea sp.]|nr:amidohydrolase family protein [Hoeflea sp.]
MIVDTHLHVIDPSALDYPWLASVPPLNKPWSYESYALEARRAGISQTLHMEVDVAPAQIEDETHYVGDLARLPGSLITGAIASCRPEDPGFAAYLDRQRENPLVKGFRRVLHVVPDEVSQQALFRDNIRRLSGTGLSFDLCVQARQLPLAMALADLAPDVQFILDNCRSPWRSP